MGRGVKMKERGRAERGGVAGMQRWAIAHSHIAHFHSLKRCEYAIAHFVAL